MKQAARWFVARPSVYPGVYLASVRFTDAGKYIAQLLATVADVVALAAAYRLVRRQREAPSP